MIVLVTIAFAAAALVLFQQRAVDDLLIATRTADANRLRVEAYSALETTLAVLEDFRLVNGGLRSPSEGWNDPLEWAEYIPENENRKIEITFLDESGKLSLPNTPEKILRDLFTTWELPDDQINLLTEALLTWVKPDYTPTEAGVTRPEDYEQTPVPFAPPGRSLRSWDELKSIDVIRDHFYDEAGHLTELGQRFINAFSLYSFNKSNVNAGLPDTLATLGEYEELEQTRINDYLHGNTAGHEPGFFKSINEVSQIAGGISMRTDMGTQISALWIIVTVTEGQSNYRLSALVAPKNGATPPKAAANKNNSMEVRDTSGQTRNNNKQRQTAANENQRRTQGKTTANAAADQAAKKTGDLSGQNTKLNYPFTLLDLRENDFPLETPATSDIEEIGN